MRKSVWGAPSAARPRCYICVVLRVRMSVTKDIALVMETSESLQREHSEINCRELTAIEVQSHIYYRALSLFLLLYQISGYPPYQALLII